MSPTGGWETFTTVNGSISSPPAGTTTLYLTFSGGAGALFDVDSFTFTTGGTGGGGGGVGPVVGLGGMCLDVDAAGTADGTEVQVYGCNGTAAQRWTVGSDGTVRALGKCLDVDAAGTADGTRVQLWTCNGTGAQVWEPRPDGTVVNPASGKCLDVSENRAVDGQAVHLWTCYGGPNQVWTLP